MCFAYLVPKLRMDTWAVGPTTILIIHEVPLFCICKWCTCKMVTHDHIYLWIIWFMFSKSSLKNLCQRGHFKPHLSHLKIKQVKDITIPTQYCMLPDFNILCNHSFAGRNKPKYLWGPTPTILHVAPGQFSGSATVGWSRLCMISTAFCTVLGLGLDRPDLWNITARSTNA